MPTLNWKQEANDVIIPLMGPTGAGKSTFINLIAGKEVTTVGHDLESCTVRPLPVVIDSLQSDLLNDGRLVLVDTPGLVDTADGYADILRGIDSWLETNSRDSHGHKAEAKLAGIVYLHDISLTRKLGSTPKLDVFQKLCGKDAVKRVVICTTKWSDVYQDDGEKRTEHLKENYWKEMIEGGSTVRKFEDSQKSAWDVIVPIIKEDRFVKLQEELEKLIPSTEEGPQLRNSLNQLLKSLKQASSNDSFPRKELDAQIAAIRAISVTRRIFDLVDKFINKYIAPPSPSRGNKLSVPAVGARLQADVKELVMLLGETETSYERLLTLSAAEITNFGSDEQATTEVRCWSVKREGLKPLFVVAAPSFDSHRGGGNLEKIRTWLGRSCREDMQFGIIYIRNPSPSGPSHAGRAFEFVRESDFKFRALFATFASEATGAVDRNYHFDGSVASFQETSEQASKMFDIALRNLVELDLLLEALQAIWEGATKWPRIR